MSAPITERLHEQLHRLPGIPPHTDAERLHHNLTAQRRHARNHDRHHRSPTSHTSPPRILMAWQNWIGGLSARRGSRR